MNLDLSLIRQIRAALFVNKEPEATSHTPAAPACTWMERESFPLASKWEWIAFPLMLFVSTRIALLGFAQIALTLIPDLYVPWGEREFLQQYPALDGLCRWDCEHFGRIARMGYSNAGETNFFPLYPLLTRALHAATGLDYHLSLLIVSNLASLGTFLVIYRIFAMLSSKDAAQWALVLFAVYPFAFFQATGYPESLMTFFSALAILFALQGHHIWAGVALGLGVLTRHLTLFAGAALLAAQLHQRGLNLKRFLLNPAILGLLVPWLCLGLYCLYQAAEFGNPLAFWAARANWGPFAWWGIDKLFVSTEINDHVRVINASLPFAIILTAGAIALLTRKQWIELAAFALVLMVVIWAVGLLGLGRYAASCWPAFLPLGSWLAQRPNWQGPVIGLLALFQGLFFYLFVHQFPII
jgi:Gpi18-like mannosyltransferase